MSPAASAGKSVARTASRAGGAVAAAAGNTVRTSRLTLGWSGLTSLTSSPTTVAPDVGGGGARRARGTLPRRPVAFGAWCEVEVAAGCDDAGAAADDAGLVDVVLVGLLEVVVFV